MPLQTGSPHHADRQREENAAHFRLDSFRFARGAAVRFVTVAFVGAFVFLGAPLPAAHAAPFITNTTADNATVGDGFCTLREAMESANNAGNGDCGGSSGADDTITFSVTGTIALGSQLPGILSGQGALTIDGVGQNVIVSGGSAVRVMQVNAGASLTLQNLVIANGRVAGEHGAGVLNNGTLTVTNSTFTGNAITGFGNGGGIYNGSTLTVVNSTFSGNSAFIGGGLATDNPATTSIANSTFSGNSAVQGGGINNYISTLTITNSTFVGNGASAVGGGGGLYNSIGSTTVTNSTFSGNSGDGIGRSNGIVTLRNTIVANSIGANCGANAAVTNGGNNIDDGATCGWGPASGSMSSTNPGLGAITGNPAYFPLNGGSPAIDAGTNAGCPATSQNGVARPADSDGNGTATCDIGAYETPSALPTLDVDASITATKYDALTDGLIILRYLFGATGSSLTTNALGGTATRIDPGVMTTHLDGIRTFLDIDGNGVTETMTDGLLIIRYLFGLRGGSLVAGAADPQGSRPGVAEIEAYLQLLVP